MKKFILGLAGLSLVAGNAAAAWGFKYEVFNGTTWTNKLTVNVYNGAVDVPFRMSVWNDGKSKVNIYKNGKYLVATPALQPLRVQVSSRISNWGTTANGDQMVSMQKEVISAGSQALLTSMAAKDTVVGVAKGVYSFFGNLKPLYADYAQSTPELTYFTGVMRIGNNTAAAKNRTIKVAANTIGAPSPNSGNGGAYGASFYTARKPADIASGIANTYAVNYYSLITVVSNGPRPEGIMQSQPDFATTDVPTPGVLALLPLGAIAACRRNRR